MFQTMFFQALLKTVQGQPAGYKYQVFDFGGRTVVATFKVSGEGRAELTVSYFPTDERFTLGTLTAEGFELEPGLEDLENLAQAALNSLSAYIVSKFFHDRSPAALAIKASDERAAQARALRAERAAKLK